MLFDNSRTALFAKGSKGVCQKYSSHDVAIIFKDNNLTIWPVAAQVGM